MTLSTSQGRNQMTLSTSQASHNDSLETERLKIQQEYKSLFEKTKNTINKISKEVEIISSKVADVKNWLKEVEEEIQKYETAPDECDQLQRQEREHSSLSQRNDRGCSAFINTVDENIITDDEEIQPKKIPGYSF